MNYRQPTLLDRDALIDYMGEHYDNGEKSIQASNMLPVMKYEDWIDKLLNDSTVGDKDWGLSETYLAIVNNKIIGLLNVRYTLSLEMADMYGHIGIGVRPSERRKGYAKKMLEYGLHLCRDRGLDEVILGCYKDNIGSKKTIEANNGILYRETTLDDKPAIYYKIKL